MPNRKYRAGEDLARAAKIYLESNGYYVVKAGGSRGIADLVALKSGENLMVQCKLSDGAMSPADRDRLVGEATLRAPVCLCCRLVPLVCHWHKEGTAARRLAFWELTGSHIGQRRPWTPDHGLELGAIKRQLAGQ